MFKFLRKKKLKENESDMEKKLYKENLSFFSWVQEFTKKIITITFWIYVLINVISIGLIIVTYFQTGELSIDTLIMETNQTFRDVIGGYIIKAACENICKGIGIIIDKFMQNKNSNYSYNNHFNPTTIIVGSGEEDGDDPGLIDNPCEDDIGEESDLEHQINKNPFANLKRKE